MYQGYTDLSKKRTPLEKIMYAAMEYEAKYGVAPTSVLVNPSQLIDVPGMSVSPGSLAGLIVAENVFYFKVGA